MIVRGLASLLVLVLSCGEAAAYDGNALYDECRDYNKRQNLSDQQALKFTACHWYVMAAVDLLAAQAIVPSVKACLPENLKYPQAVDVTLNYLRDHPEVRHHNAASLIVLAMAQAFPCK